jgi:hypothetical protein
VTGCWWYHRSGEWSPGNWQLGRRLADCLRGRGMRPDGPSFCAPSPAAISPPCCCPIGSRRAHPPHLFNNSATRRNGRGGQWVCDHSEGETKPLGTFSVAHEPQRKRGPLEKVSIARVGLEVLG